jgi:hypothetical protein
VIVGHIHLTGNALDKGLAAASRLEHGFDATLRMDLELERSAAAGEEGSGAPPTAADSRELDVRSVTE